METNGHAGAKMSLNSLGSLFSATWKLYKDRWKGLVEIALLPTLVMVLGYVLLWLGHPFSILGALVVFVGWFVFVFSVMPIIFSIHHSTGVDASYKATLGWFWPFVWVIIIEILAVIGGWIMVIIPGIWLAVSLSFTAYVFVIERRRGLDALRQSKDYVKGYWWPVWGRMLLVGVPFVIVEAVLEAIFAAAGGRVLASIVGMVLTLFILPYTSIYNYLIFQNLRELKPEMATAEKKEGGGFIMASAIVGIAVPVLVVFALVAFGAIGAIRAFHGEGPYAPPPGYGVQNY
ncbi:MAG TPA: hypothetical protein VMA75_04435 [Candidatus Paceibacterota bacterium]|nr:hypothetical protein [Candidatus Paceibacterota bacterium]